MYKLSFQDDGGNELASLITSLVPTKGEHVYIYGYEGNDDPLVGVVEAIDYFYYSDQRIDITQPNVIIELDDIQYPKR